MSRRIAAHAAVALALCSSTALVEAPLGALRPSAGPTVDAPAAEAETDRVPARDVSLSLHVGGWKDTGVVFGGTGLFRTGPFAVGGLVEGGGRLVDYSYTAVAGVAGLGIRTRFGLRFDALAVSGAHAYTGVGKGFSSDPGGSGTLPFVGGRVGLSCSLGTGPAFFDLGLWAFAEDDLDRATAHVTYDERGLFGSGSRSTSEHTIGASRTGFAVRLGVTCDL